MFGLLRHIARLRSKLSTAKPPAFRSDGAAEPAVDPAFYGRYYPDLSGLDDTALRAHFTRHGRAEGRFPEARDLIAALEAEHGPLPSDFLAQVYRARFPDLARMEHAWELEAHYLRYGRHENRSHRMDLSVFEDEFLRYKIRRIGLTERSAFEQGFETFREMLEATRAAPGVWLARFGPHAFARLNADWLPCVPDSRMEGICLFLQHGIERLAPIDDGERFDPDAYRASRPDLPARTRDADLYRDWLNQGLLRGPSGGRARP